MKYDAHGAEMSLGGKPLGRIESGVVRLITNKIGVPQALLGISEEPQNVRLRLADQKSREVVVRANQRIPL
jgi:hypothetical protein